MVVAIDGGVEIRSQESSSIGYMTLFMYKLCEILVFVLKSQVLLFEVLFWKV